MSNSVPPISWLKAFGNRNLHLVLFMTEQCNFRCVYCYEDFKLGNIRADVVSGIKHLIRKRIDQLDSLEISYFGGEPLMNKKGVLDISSWAKAIAKEKGIRYRGEITTNGYALGAKTFHSLVSAGVTEYQITLDGDQNWHDATRPTMNKKPTFDKIHQNLLLMSASDLSFQCLLRMNVADNNLEGVRQFLLKNATTLGQDKRIKLHFHPIWGLPELELTRRNEVQVLTDLAIKLGYNGLAVTNEKGRSEEYVCYAAKADSFSIRANGKVQKCTVALANPLNDIGKIHPDGTLELDEAKYKQWIFAEQKDCPLKYFELEKLAVAYEGAGKFAEEAVA